MAWERTWIPFVVLSHLKLAIGSWGGATGLFYVRLRNGPVPAKIKIKIVEVDSPGIAVTERTWEGHWRGLPPDFNSHLGPKERSEYGLIGIGVQAVSRHPALFIWSNEGATTGTFPPVSLDAPLDQQGVTRVDIVVTCESDDGYKGRLQEFSYHISPDPGSSVGYRIGTGVPALSWPARMWRHVLHLAEKSQRGPQRKGGTHRRR
jgi:hypothetical protein